MPCAIASRLSGRCLRAPSARSKHATGQGAGVLAVVEDGLAADDDVMHAFGALHAAG